MINENLCSIFIFPEHRKMKKENLFQILIFLKDENLWSIFKFFSGLHNGNETKPEIRIQ